MIVNSTEGDIGCTRDIQIYKICIVKKSKGSSIGGVIYI